MEFSMQQRIVLVRGDCGKPARLVAVHELNGLIFVSSERAAAADESAYPPPIGVPRADVFRFEANDYERLRSKWEREGSTDKQDWDQLETVALQVPAK
jgi:hypothetical protein